MAPSNVSIELRPQMQSLSMSTDDIIWTHERSIVPAMLANRGVGHATWERTFDALKGIYDEQYTMARDFRKKMGLFLFIPCYGLCSMNKHIQAAQTIHAHWADLVRSQAETYRPYGIQVTLAKELVSSGFGSDRHMRNETVGLRFEVADENGGGNHYGTSLPTNSGGNDAVSKISKLNDLYKTGAISSDEYNRLKGQIINGI
uniref:SHOCT domain-containing protein n=1 Tax=Pseudictyota dubia TaxID=2749911 RepID=A0A7R9WKN4_9STRA